MRIAFDITPLSSGHFLQHQVRGSGFYVQHLKDALLNYFPDNEYHFFKKGDSLPKDTEIIHHPYFEPFFLTLPLHKSAPTVITVHDLTPILFPKHFPSGIKGRLRWEIQKVLLKKMDGIITDSKVVSSDIRKTVGLKNDKTFVVPLAAAEEFGQITKSKSDLDLLRKKYGLPEEFALYVGDITWNKNVPHIVEAAAKAEIHLVLAGKAIAEENFDRSNPWNKDRIKIHVLAKDNPYIHILGFVPNDDLVALYNEAAFFVMPSYYEGFGLPILEAMSCGCPVITSERGSLPEVAGNAALYVNPEDVESITNGMKKIFSDLILRKKMQEMGLKQAKTFSWQKTAGETIEVYKKILSHKK